MVKYVELLRSTFPKLGTAPKTRNPPSRAHALDELPPCWVPKVSRCRTGHYWSALDLRLQGALRSHFQDSHMPDARLYSLAKLQQFSKNACNSKHFSLNRPVFVEPGVAGTFPDNSTPIYFAHPRSLDGTTSLTHRYTQDRKHVGMKLQPKASAAWMTETND